MSLGARLTNVFIGPWEVFEEVKQGPPSLANWLVPALLLCLVGVVSAFVIFSYMGLVLLGWGAQKLSSVYNS
jgi:hypothetical protein